MVERDPPPGHIAGGRDVEHLDAIDGFVRAVAALGGIGAKRRRRQQVGDPAVLGHPLKVWMSPYFWASSTALWAQTPVTR